MSKPSRKSSPAKGQQPVEHAASGTLAEPVSEQPTGEPAQPAAPNGKNPAAVALGRLGGKKGGLARAAKLTKKQRSEIARKAAKARWGKQKS